MSPPRRRSRDAYKPPRRRGEIATAVAAVVGVLLVTAALIWFLQPDDSDPGQPNIPSPASLPGGAVPSPPPEPAPPAPAPPSAP